MPLGRLFESAWYNPILKAVPMSMGILMSGNAGYAIAGNMSDNVVIVQQQTISVTGTVIDASGEPLVGVNIVEAGTVNGVISDFEGKFTLNVKPNATLKISYIGYIVQNILVKGQKNLTITLQEDTETLDEVVVVGYGTVRKADLAGSVSVLDSRNFKDQPITQVSDALQGRVAGVNVVSDGVPGGSVKIRIRGTNSINKSNDPLYVVDGMVRESGLEGINPEDIQSMQILKDASVATATSVPSLNSAAHTGTLEVASIATTSDILNVFFAMPFFVFLIFVMIIVPLWVVDRLIFD